MASGNVFRGIAFNEIVLILFPAILLRKKFKFKEGGQINKKKFIYVSLSIVCAFPLILLINGGFLSLLSQVFQLENDGLEVLRKNQSFFQQIIFLAFLPSIAEELLFRGVYEKTFLKYGKVFGLFFSALLFSFFHFEFQNFLAPFLFGLLLAYIYLHLNHLIYVIYGHFLHNFISILFLHFYNESSISRLSNLSIVKLTGNVQSFFMIFLVLLGILALFGLRKSLLWIGDIQVKEDKKRKLAIGALAPYIVVFGIYIYTCMLGG